MDTAEVFQSDEPTLELVTRAQSGDAAAVEALLERSLPQLRRWAHGRLSPIARGYLDTNDVVQDAVFQMLRRVPVFVPRHVGAMQAFLRRTVTNRIYDEMRRIARQPRPIALADDQPCTGISPQEAAIRAETYQRYRDTLPRLRPRDRALVIARIELQWSFVEIAQRFRMASEAAVRMPTKRALRRFEARMNARRGHSRLTVW